MLVYHQKDKRLRTLYCHFKQFAYQIMLKESDKSISCWPDALTQKKWDLIIKFQAKQEIESHYNQEIQSLCKTPYFGKYPEKFTEEQSSEQVSINKSFLYDIVSTATAKALLLTSIIFGVRPTKHSQLPDHSINMRLVSMLVIICQSTY